MSSPAESWTSVEDLTADGLDPEAVVSGVRATEPRLREIWQTLADRFVRIAEGKA